VKSFQKCAAIVAKVVTRPMSVGRKKKTRVRDPSGLSLARAQGRKKKWLQQQFTVIPRLNFCYVE